MSESRTAALDDALRRPRIVDLTLGAWRAREAAFQLAAEAGVELASLFPGDPERSMMDSGIRATDIAATGDTLIMIAFDDAARIGPALPGGGVVAVLAPRSGLPLRIENEWFFTFLRRHGLSVALVGDDLPTALGKTPFERRRGLTGPDIPAPEPAFSVEQRRLLRFFPGLLPRVLLDKSGIDARAAGLIAVGTNHFLIPPAWRDRDPRASGRDFDAMADFEKLDDGLHALAQTFCTGYFAEPQALIALSEKAQAAGSLDIARDLAERGRLAARQPDDIVLADTRRVEVALAERRHAEVTALAEPSRLAAAGPKDRLRRLKTRAQIRAGDFVQAERPLAVVLARMQNQERLDTEDLQMVSDAAEARLRADDPGGAFVLAEDLEAALQRDPRHDRRVAFAAAMTLARIHRLRGDMRDYRTAVARAYATGRGALSLHEVMELNLLEAAGERDPQSPTVRLCWLRAGLAWLAIEPSEGLSRSAMVVVLGKEVPRWQLDIDVSDVMGSALEAAWPELAAPTRPRFPGLRRADGRQRPATMFAGEGAGVLWTPAGGSGVANTRARQRLIRLVLAGLARLQPRFAEVETGTILIDTNLGIDIPRTRAEAQSVALRTGVRDFVFGADTITLDEDLRPRFAGDLTAAIAPLVAAIDEQMEGLRVTFHRHLPPRVLSEGERRIIEPLRERKGFALSALAEHLGKGVAEAEPEVRLLEADRVIRLDAESR